MPDQTLRTLSEPEFNAIRDRLLAEAPDGLSERDFQLWIGPRLAAAVGEAEASAPTPEGSALGRFASNAAEVLNPVAMVKGVAGAIRHPIDTVGNIAAASADQGRKALAAAREGQPFEAFGHGLGMFPIIGPAAAEAGEQIAQGDIAGGLGRGVGLLIPAAAPSAVRTAVRGVKAAAPEGVRAAVAGRLEAGAAERVADVMSPKVGANKTRFGNAARDVAPDLVAEKLTGGYSREALHSKVSAKFEEATAALDAAADARLSARSFPTQPLIAALKAKVKALTSEAVDASQYPPPGRHTYVSRAQEQAGFGPAETPIARPVGESVVTSPNVARVAALEQAIKELQQLGPVTRYDPIRNMRMAYDEVAKAKYNPSVTVDFLKAQGGANAAADITGVLREQMAKWDPKTAQANAGYSLFKKAQDVLKAAEETERARPTMFRKAMNRVTGAAAGGGMGVLVAEVVDSMASAGWTTQLKTADLMAKLATAIRRGDGGYVATLSNQLKRMGAQAAALTGNATSPSGSQTPQGSPVPATR